MHFDDDYLNSAELSDYKEEPDQNLENSKQDEFLLKAEKEREQLLEKLNKLDKSIQDLKPEASQDFSKSRSKRFNKNKSIDLNVSNNEAQSKRIKELLDTPAEDREVREQKLKATKNKHININKKKGLEPIPAEVNIQDKIEKPEDQCTTIKKVQTKKKIRVIKFDKKNNDEQKEHQSFVTNMNQSPDEKTMRNIFAEEAAE